MLSDRLAQICKADAKNAPTSDRLPDAKAVTGGWLKVYVEDQESPAL